MCSAVSANSSKERSHCWLPDGNSLLKMRYHQNVSRPWHQIALKLASSSCNCFFLLKYYTELYLPNWKPWVEIYIRNIWHFCDTRKAKYKTDVSGRKSNDRFDLDIHYYAFSSQCEQNERMSRGSHVFLPSLFNLRKSNTDFDKICAFEVYTKRI